MRSIRDVISQDGASLGTVLLLAPDEARIEVQCLLQHVLNVQRAYLLAHPEQVLSEDRQKAYDVLLQRRMRGEPVAHLLGEREFFGLSFKVTPDTLIPRPETELLVELALQWLTQRSNPSPALPLSGEGAELTPPLTRGGREGFELRVLDLGTGTGAIALSIAHARPDVEVVAVDASDAALQVARENAQRLGVRNVSFVQSDWFSALDAQRFDLIVSNPPYIAADDEHLARGDVRFEPLSALASGADGLDDIRRIASKAGGYLKENGWLLFEHGYDQAESVRDLLRQNGFSKIFLEKDLAGIDRVSGGEFG